MSQKQLESECLEAFEQGNKRDAERLLPQIRQPATVRTGSIYDTVIVNGITIYIHSGSSLLHLAAAHGWMDVVINLITKYKCDVNCRNYRKRTPLHYASLAGHLEVVRYFINEQHCDPMTKDNGTGHHFTMLVKRVTSTLPSTSSINNTVTQKTCWVRHHFTMLVNVVATTLCNIYYPLVKWTHWLGMMEARLQCTMLLKMEIMIY